MSFFWVSLQVNVGLGAIIPEQVHLAFADKGLEKAMTFSWFTPVNTSSFVHIGRATGSYDRLISGYSVTYMTHTWIHHVLVTDLAPLTRYFYVVGDVAGWSEEFSFLTSPEEGDMRPFSMGVLGDMGLIDSNTTLKLLMDKRSEYDFLYHVGDMTYADDDILHPSAYEGIWNAWAGLMQPISATLGYMVLPGNHEASCRQIGSVGCDKRLDNFTAYRSRFRMPSPQSGGAESMWYSFNYGMAHVVSLSTETDLPHAPEGPGTLWNAGPFGDQLSWLHKDLAFANSAEQRAVRPWVIVAGHRPMYSVAAGEFPPRAREQLASVLEPVLLQHNVDLYITAHVHGYERSWPLCAKGKVEQKHYDRPKCLVHLLNGAAGNVEGHAVMDKPADFSAFINNKNFGFGILDFVNRSYLSWRFLREDGLMEDGFSLVRDH